MRPNLGHLATETLNQGKNWGGDTKPNTIQQNTKLQPLPSSPTAPTPGHLGSEVSSSCSRKARPHCGQGKLSQHSSPNWAREKGCPQAPLTLEAKLGASCWCCILKLLFECCIPRTPAGDRLWGQLGWDIKVALTQQDRISGKVTFGYTDRIDGKWLPIRQGQGFPHFTGRPTGPFPAR